MSASDRPRVRTPDRGGEEAVSAPAPGTEPATVLVADDDRLTRELLANILRKHGYLVETCEDGQEAVERVARGGDRALPCSTS